MTNAIGSVTVDVHLDAEWIASRLLQDVVVGLSSVPKELPPKWFYDDLGSELFDQITRLDEYYPTEAERGILHREAEKIADVTRADTFVELGSGTSDKTMKLLEAFNASGQLKTFIPFDRSETTLRDAVVTVAELFPDLSVHGVVGDFEHHLEEIPPIGQRRLVALFGGTIGNFGPRNRASLLASMAAQLRPGDSMLLGVDLVKDSRRLVRAYDDQLGITAAFNKNVLTVINRELEANFNLQCFEHVVRFDVKNEWIEMWLRSLDDQVVQIGSADMTVEFARDEMMRTEVSAKFHKVGVEAELDAAGLNMAHFWTDAAGDYALSLGVKRS